MPPKTRPKRKSQVSPRQGLSKIKFEEFWQQLELAKSKKDLIYPLESQNYIREIIKDFKANGELIHHSWIHNVIEQLEGDDTCSRIHESIFVLIIEMILQAEDCRDGERGMYLLSASLFNDSISSFENSQAFLISRKKNIGKESLLSLVKYFTSADKNFATRRWVGILCLQLHKGCSENHDLIDKSLEKYRYSLGRLIIDEHNKLLKIICGNFVKDLHQAGTSLDRLFPRINGKKIYDGFPEATTDIDNWIQLFQNYLNNLSSQAKTSEERVNGVYFIKSVALYPDFTITSKNYDVCLLLDGNYIVILAPSNEITFDQILEIPFHAISTLRLIPYETEDKITSLIPKIRFHEGSKGNIFLNGKAIDSSICALQISPCDSKPLLDQITVSFPGFKLEDETISQKEVKRNQRNFSRLSNHSSTCEIMVSNVKPDTILEKCAPPAQDFEPGYGLDARTNTVIDLDNKNYFSINMHESNIANNFDTHASDKAHGITGHFTRRLIHGLKTSCQHKIIKPKAKQPLLVSRRSLAPQITSGASRQATEAENINLLAKDNVESNRINAPRLVVKLAIPSLARNFLQHIHGNNGVHKLKDTHITEKCDEGKKKDIKHHSKISFPKSNCPIKPIAPDYKFNEQISGPEFIGKNSKFIFKNDSEATLLTKEMRAIQKFNSQNIKKSTTSPSIKSEGAPNGLKSMNRQEFVENAFQKDSKLVTEVDETSNLTPEAFNLLQEDARILGLAIRNNYDNLNYDDYFDASPKNLHKNLVKQEDTSINALALKNGGSGSGISDVPNSRLNLRSAGNFSIQSDHIDTISFNEQEKYQNGDKLKSNMELSDLAQSDVNFYASNFTPKKKLRVPITNLAQIPEFFESEKMQNPVERVKLLSEPQSKSRHAVRNISHIELTTTSAPLSKKSQDSVASGVTRKTLTEAEKNTSSTRKRKPTEENCIRPKKNRIYEELIKKVSPNLALEACLLEPISPQTPQNKQSKKKLSEKYKPGPLQTPVELTGNVIKESDNLNTQLEPKLHFCRAEIQKTFEGSNAQHSNLDMLDDQVTRKPHVISFGPDGALNQGQVYYSKITDNDSESKPNCIDYMASSSRIRSDHRQKSSEKVFSKPRMSEEVDFKNNSSPCTTPPKSPFEEKNLTIESHSNKHLDKSMSRSAAHMNRPRVGFMKSYQRSKVTKNGSPICRKHSHQNQIDNISIKMPSLDCEKQFTEENSFDQKSKISTAFGPKYFISKVPKMGPSPPEAGMKSLVRHETIDNIHYKDLTSHEVISREKIQDPFRTRASWLEPKNQFVELLRESVSQTHVKNKKFIGRKPEVQSSRVQRSKTSNDLYFSKLEKNDKLLQVSPTTILPGPTEKRQISIDSWNIALHPHYQGVHDVVHRIANDLIIRLAKEEDCMRMIIDQYIENGAKIVEQLMKNHEEERAMILQGLDTTKAELINLQIEAQIAISEVYGGIRENLISMTAKEWNKLQDEIRKFINDGRRD